MVQLQNRTFALWEPLARQFLLIISLQALSVMLVGNETSQEASANPWAFCLPGVHHVPVILECTCCLKAIMPAFCEVIDIAVDPGGHQDIPGDDPVTKVERTLLPDAHPPRVEHFLLVSLVCAGLADLITLTDFHQ